MKFKSFTFKNFKGIKNMTVNLSTTPRSNIYTLVGLNESGKTTILEAISNFDSNPDYGPGDTPITTLEKDPEAFLPLSERANFDGQIYVGATLELEPEDLNVLNKYIREKTEYHSVEPIITTSYHRHYNFSGSIYKDTNRYWDGIKVRLKDNPKKEYVKLWGRDNNTWHELDKILIERIPNIVYFPNFLFDFPSRIYLEEDILSTDDTRKEEFYIGLIQDILDSLNIGATVEKSLVNRIRSTEKHEKENLRSLIHKMERQVTSVIFTSWNELFKKPVNASKVSIDTDLDGDRPYLEFHIDGPDAPYGLKDMSLGFRWFFTFLIFTQFRQHRPNSKKGLIFLFDEPASNLHSSAQAQLLKSFENYGKNVKIIYSTHSHYMINPRWLENTYVVKNEGFDLQSPDSNILKNTSILIEPYKRFVSANPHQTDYIQPVLDVLEYRPSDLEKVPNCVILEGKNDFYTLKYFNEVIFGNGKDLALMPGLSSTALDSLISMYLGWGKNFIILLDSDKAGQEQKQRYLENFGDLLLTKIYTLSDIDTSWPKKPIEKLFDPDEALSFQKTAFPNINTFRKDKFNKTIQEKLVLGEEFDFSDDTRNKFEKLLKYLKERLEETKT